MTETNLFSKAIIQKIKSAEQEIILQPVQIGQTEKQNELVFFIKPELFAVDDDEKITNSLQMIREKIEKFEVEVNGAVIIPGSVLEEHGIMNRHYGFINQLSRKASEMIDAETRSHLFTILGNSDQAQHQIFGGHEFITHFNTDVDTLSNIWFSQEAKKLRSGFYFIEDTFQGQLIILVNGFHPSQLLHFTRNSHRILLLLLHTDTDWMEMKFDLVGDTFPERAKPGSIRGELYSNPKFFGQKEVGINTNGVHLSAGPFEAAFEVSNFFGALLDLDPEKTPPLAIKKASESGLSESQALNLLKNPKLNDSDLFSETENLNTPAAISLMKDAFSQE